MFHQAVSEKLRKCDISTRDLFMWKATFPEAVIYQHTVYNSYVKFLFEFLCFRTHISNLANGFGNIKGAADYKAKLADLNKLVKNVLHSTWLDILTNDGRIVDFLLLPKQQGGLKDGTIFEHIKNLLNYAGNDGFPKKEDIERMLDKKVSICICLKKCFGRKRSVSPS